MNRKKRVKDCADCVNSKKNLKIEDMDMNLHISKAAKFVTLAFDGFGKW